MNGRERGGWKMGGGEREPDIDARQEVNKNVLDIMGRNRVR